MAKTSLFLCRLSLKLHQLVAELKQVWFHLAGDHMQSVEPSQPLFSLKDAQDGQKMLFVWNERLRLGLSSCVALSPSANRRVWMHLQIMHLSTHIQHSPETMESKLSCLPFFWQSGQPSPALPNVVVAPWISPDSWMFWALLISLVSLGVPWGTDTCVSSDCIFVNAPDQPSCSLAVTVTCFRKHNLLPNFVTLNPKNKSYVSSRAVGSHLGRPITEKSPRTGHF